MSPPSLATPFSLAAPFSSSLAECGDGVKAWINVNGENEVDYFGQKYWGRQISLHMFRYGHGHVNIWSFMPMSDCWEILRSKVLRWAGCCQMLEREHQRCRCTSSESHWYQRPTSAQCYTLLHTYLAIHNNGYCQCMSGIEVDGGWFLLYTRSHVCHTHAEALCRLYRAFEDSQGPFKTTSTPHSATADLFFVVGKSEISET